MRKVHIIAVLAAGVAALAAATAATSGSPGFKTSQGAMIDPVAPGASYEAIISVGDTLEDGYMFESIPDGISIATNGKGTVDLYVNHETSTVPFPYTFNRRRAPDPASTTSRTRSSASCGCTRSPAAS